MRVLVCGGRDFDDSRLMYRVLDALYLDRDSTLIHGDARGADRMAQRWAEERALWIESYPADWESHGKAAGFIRNQQMLDEGKPDLVVAFPGGKGTAMMVELASKAGVPVIQVEYVTPRPAQ